MKSIKKYMYENIQFCSIFFFAILFSGNIYADKCEFKNYSRTKIEKLIIANANRYKLDKDFLWAVIKVESNFNPCAISSAGAQGLMQLMPATAQDLNIPDSFDPEQNIEGGSRLLAELLQKYKIYQYVLVAYNAGPGALKKYRMIPPYSETKKYIRNVVRVYERRKGRLNI